jgi:hypothetical protein
MKIFFRLVLVMGLGVIAVGLDLTLWNLWRTGYPHTTPIMGAVTRYGITSANPAMVLSFMTLVFNALFVAGILAWIIPGAGIWLRQKTDVIWPPAKDPDPGPSWICAHCHEENPGNFGECWKCQRLRDPPSGKS